MLCEYRAACACPPFIETTKSPNHRREALALLRSEEMEVPTTKDLAEIYPEDYLDRQTKRWNSLISTFKETYGKLPDYVARSPGRVNLIGEVRCSRDLDREPHVVAGLLR